MTAEEFPINALSARLLIVLSALLLLAACSTASPVPVALPTSIPQPTATPPSFWTPSQTGVPRYRLDIHLNAVDRRLDVTQSVEVRNETPDTWHEVVFSAPPAHLQGVFSLQSVTDLNSAAPLTGTLDGIMLAVIPAAPIEPGAGLHLEMTYALQIPEIESTASLPEGNLGAGEDVIQAGDWLPALVPYQAGTGWFTWDYHPVGDPFVYGVGDFEVQLSAGSDLVVAAPGFVEQRGPVRIYHLPRARTFAFLASYDYEVIERRVQGIPLRAFYLPDYADAAQAALDAASQALELYQELYGPYPYPDLVIAQNAYSGSMEYSGLVSMSRNTYETYRAGDPSSVVWMTAHETAHQWWYGAVGSDQVHEPWLDESLAKYSELLFFERYDPESVAVWWEDHIFPYGAGGMIDRPIYDFASTPMYMQQLYGRGARFIADLRAALGDEAFFAFLRAYREQGDGRIVTGEEFFALLLESTGVDLQPLREEYFE